MHSPHPPPHLQRRSSSPTGPHLMRPLKGAPPHWGALSRSPSPWSRPGLHCQPQAGKPGRSSGPSRRPQGRPPGQAGDGRRSQPAAGRWLLFVLMLSTLPPAPPRHVASCFLHCPLFQAMPGSTENHGYRLRHYVVYESDGKAQTHEGQVLCLEVTRQEMAKPGPTRKPHLPLPLLRTRRGHTEKASGSRGSGSGVQTQLMQSSLCN